MEELINESEIYLQDVVCSVVAQNIDEEDYVLYNMISTMVDITSLSTADKILSLIQINKMALKN